MADPDGEALFEPEPLVDPVLEFEVPGRVHGVRHQCRKLGVNRRSISHLLNQWFAWRELRKGYRVGRR